jgi:flagellar biosynthesis chaperone FliJ
MEEARQDLNDVQEQLKLVKQERNEYQYQVIRVLALAGRVSGKRAERTHKGCESLCFSGTDRRVL